MEIKSSVPSSSRSKARKASTTSQAPVLPREAAPEASTDDKVLFSGPIEPKSGVIYQVHEFPTRPINLSFDNKAIAFFHNAGLKFDLEQAHIVTQDGRRVPFDHRAPVQATPQDLYAVSEGYKLPATAEPWQFRVPGIPSQVFGKPYGVHISGAEQGLSLKFLDAEGAVIDRESPNSSLDDSQGMRVDTKVLRRSRSKTLGQLASHKPLEGSPGPAELPFTDKSIGNVEFRAPSQSALDTVKETYENLLGPVTRERSVSVDLTKLEIYEAEVQANIQKKLAAGGDVDGNAAMLESLDDPKAYQAMQDIYGMGAETLSRAELLNEVMEKTMKASPLEIVVIPRDKTALDCVEGANESTQHQLKNAGRAYFLRSNPVTNRVQTGSKDLSPQRLFIGEEILDTELGVNAVLKHELLHVFEHLLATPEESQHIESSFQQATEFQSLYGSNRDEYITTLGEEFFGAHGPGGAEWVKEHHPQVFELLSTLTDKE